MDKLKVFACSDSAEKFTDEVCDYLQIEKDESFEKNKEFEKEIEETEKSKILFYLLKTKLNISEITEETSKKMDYKCLRFSIQLFKRSAKV